MITLEKLRVIAKAKFSDKSNLGNWYQKRLDICESCPFNSKNKEELTLRDKAVVAMNMGNPSCLACTCEIAAKASVRAEQCGLAKINQEPLWEALPEVEVSKFSDITIENLTPNIANMSIGDKVILDYGIKKQGANTLIEISLRDKDNKITRVDTRSGCGCTVAKPTKRGETYFVTIKYDSTRMGKIDKSVTFIVDTVGRKIQFIAEIKGTITK